MKAFILRYMMKRKDGFHCLVQIPEVILWECNTEVCGIFELPLLARLSEKEQQFVLDFVKSSGSLKDMAKNIGVSYPTVRNMLDDIIDKLTKMDM